MEKIEHIGIAVKDLKQANATYGKLLGVQPYKTEIVNAENVITSFFKIGESKVELLESTNPLGVVAKFLDKKGEGLHHVAYSVKNIYDEMKRLKTEGFVLLNDEPKYGADNKLVCFIHPKDTNGVLIELCQEII